jgi:anti-sigma B factor antagonist
MSHIVEFEQQGSVLVARPLVEFIFENETVTSIQKAINDKLTEHATTSLAMDFSNVQTFASNFIGMLVGLKRKLSNQGGDLKLSGINDRLMEIINITKLNQVFSIHPSIEEAVASY